MRYLMSLFAACCWLSTAFGQWQVRYVPLPDSLSGVSAPRCVLYNPGNNTFFVAGGGSAIVVMDGVSNRKIARIPTRSPVSAMCYDPQDNKVYAVCGSAREVLAIDAAANRLIRAVGLSEPPDDVCYNPVMNRVYVVGYDRVTAIDCGTDSVVAEVTLPDWAEDICCNTVGNRVYCPMPDSEYVAVIDCSRDSVVKTFYTGVGYYEMLYNPLSHRLYISEQGDEDVTLVDTERDSVIGWLEAGYMPGTMCLNPTMNKVYVMDSDGYVLTIIDGQGDSVLGWRRVGRDHSGVAYDSLDNVVYLATYDSMAVVDCRSDSVVCEFSTGGHPGGLAYNPRQGTICAADRERPAVGVFRTMTHERLAWQTFWCDIDLMAYRPGADEVYGLVGSEAIAVYDCARTVVDREFPLGGWASKLLMLPALDRVYAFGYFLSGGLRVVRCATDTVRSIIGIDPELGELCHAAGAGKVYCTTSADSGVAVIDPEADTVTAWVLTDCRVQALEYSPEHNRLFVASLDRNRVFVMDPNADTLVAAIVTYDPAELYYVRSHRLLFCLDQGRTTLDVINVDSSRVVRTIGTGAYIHAMAESPREGELYVVAGNGVIVLDLQTLTPRPPIPIGSAARTYVFDTVACRLYGISTNPARIVVVDGRADSVIPGPLVTSGFREVAWDQGHRRLYLSYPSRSELAIVEDTVPVGLTEAGKTGVRANAATIVRGVLWLGGAGQSQCVGRTGLRDSPCASLLDAAGRRVMELRAGANDVGHLAPGVYFVREARAVRRVVVVE